MSLDLSSSFLHFKVAMSEGSENGIYLFDQFKLDANKLMLYRDDLELALPPKVVTTLVVLVENRGLILSKSELIDRVWNDSVVEESNLSQHLYLLRKTLGNKSDGTPYIETLRRRGYRFIAEVERGNYVAKNPTKGLEASREPEVEGGVMVPPVAVERHGNVLRLVDWQPPLESAPKTDVPLARTIPVKPVLYTAVMRAALAAAVPLIILTAIIVFWYQARPVNSVADSSKELNILRLTNGFIPVDAAISKDGNYFVYHETDDDVSTLWLQQVGQSNRLRLGETSQLVYAAKTFSPDGRFLYYVAHDKATNQPELYRAPSMGGPSVRLLSDIVGPVTVAAGSDEIAFLRYDQTKSRSTILVADKDGRNERVLYETALPKKVVAPPSWSPDGRFLAFGEADLSEQTAQAAVTLRVLDVTDGSIKELSKEKWDTVYRIAWTHDGAGLLTIATRGGDGYSTRRDQVYYITYPTGISRRLTNDGNRHQVWSLGVTKDNAVLAVPYSRSSQLWSVDPQNIGSIAQLSMGTADGRVGLAPLPDGRVGYIARSGEDLSIWIMNADGSGAKQISGEPRVIEELRADSQGRYFIFSAFDGRHSHLFRIGTDGGNLRQITSGDKDEIDSTTSPDGNWIVYDSHVVSEGPRSSLWRVSIDGGDAQLFSKEECSTPHFSPDGSLVSCVRDEREILVLSAADGSKIESYKLPENSTVNFGVPWTPNGGLTFIRTAKGYSNVWVIPRSPNSEPTQLTQFTSGYLTRFAYSSDGAKLYIARGYPLNDAILISNFR